MAGTKVKIETILEYKQHIVKREYLDNVGPYGVFTLDDTYFYANINQVLARLVMIDNKEKLSKEDIKEKVQEIASKVSKEVDSHGYIKDYKYY